MSCVLRPASSVLCPASSVRSVTTKILKIMSPDFMQIFVMCAVCAHSYGYQTVIICLNQIDTPPAAFLAELQKS